MKRLNQKCVYLLLFSLLVFQKAVYAETVVFAIGDWAPYTHSKNEDGKLAEQIVKEALELEGLEVKFDYYPWKRSYDMVARGQADGTFPWSFTDERDKETFISKEYLLKGEEVFFYKDGADFQWSELADLKKYRVGGTAGYSHVDTLKGEGVKVDVATTDKQNFTKLSKGRIDIFPADKFVGYGMIKSSFTPEEATKLKHHPKALSEKAYHVLFSRQSAKGKEYAEKFASGFEKLKASGRYEEVKASYLK